MTLLTFIIQNVKINQEKMENQLLIVPQSFFKLFSIWFIIILILLYVSFAMDTSIILLNIWACTGTKYA